MTKAEQTLEFISQLENADNVNVEFNFSTGRLEFEIEKDVVDDCTEVHFFDLNVSDISLTGINSNN